MREYITKEEALMALTGQFELGITMQKYSASCQKHIEAIQPKTEQEIVNPYLDKIRAEIAELDVYYDNDYFSDNKDAMFKCNDVLQIIEKYKAESEE